jgi:aryl-alcohol dehydrogenase-like predicted oxidoreductase
MQRSSRLLGNSNFAISTIGFGAWAVGGSGWEYSLGPQNDKVSIAAIHCALDRGINWIDTAAVYGLGHSEDVVARAVKSSPHKPFIFTKGSIRWRQDRSLYNSLIAASLVKEVDDSLRRLGVETIDLYQVHWPEPDDEIEEGWETLARLREQGKIRCIGVSNFSVEQMRRVQKIAPITSLQPHYSMLRRTIEAEILPFAQANNIGVISYSPMGSGLLTGKMTAESVASLPQSDWRHGNAQFQEPRLGRNLRLVKLLREIGDGHGIIPGVVAVAWTLHNPAVTGAIVGLRNVSEVEEIAPALEFQLSLDEYARISEHVSSIRWYLGLLFCRLVPGSWFTADHKWSQGLAPHRSGSQAPAQHLH